jgi:hypothetical protein
VKWQMHDSLHETGTGRWPGDAKPFSFSDENLPPKVSELLPPSLSTLGPRAYPDPVPCQGSSHSASIQDTGPGQGTLFAKETFCPS